MLTPEQIAGLQVAAGQLLDPVNDYLLREIAQRITEAGQLTSTAAYQLWRTGWLGSSRREMERRLRQLLKISQQDAETLITQAAEWCYTGDTHRFPTVQPVPFVRNAAVQQLVFTAVQLAREDLSNLTQSLGMVDPYGRALPLQRAYQNACDFAFRQVFTGAADYTTAIRQATKNLAEQGLRVIDYESGVHTSLEAAVRRNIMGGLGLMVERITQQNHDLLGCNGWEISAHANSAPDHEPIQGKLYSDAAYTALNNSLVRRIGTLNCGHVASPILLGVSSPQHTPAQLEQLRQDNETGVTVDGKHYTGYEATQMQRKLERAIRREKRRVLLSGPEGRSALQARLTRLEQEYRTFSQKAGLRTEGERLEVSGFGPGQARALKPTAVSNSPKGAAFMDITGHWYPDAKPNSHPVLEQREYTTGGVTYQVDGHNVVLDYSAQEKEIAELLEREVGGEIYLVPRVNYPTGIPTPDFLFHGKGYDLKTLGQNAGVNTIYNRVKKAKRQSRNFIIDITSSMLNDGTINQQIDKIFKSDGTAFVDEIVIIQGMKIAKVTRRT